MGKSEVTNPEIDAVIAGLSGAQRAAFINGRWNADPICSDLTMVGIVKRAPTVSWPYSVELTPLGLAVRAKLTNQPETK